MKTLQTSLSSLIVEFHKLYHEYKQPEYLEIAANLGKSKQDTSWEAYEQLLSTGRTDIPTYAEFKSANLK